MNILKNLSLTIRDYARPVLIEKQKQLLEKQKQSSKKKPHTAKSQPKGSDKKGRRRRFNNGVKGQGFASINRIYD